MHVLCYGITPEDHDWLQATARDVDRCAEYLHERRIACALAHPFYAVEAPLQPRHRRRLAELFPVWETRNGSRAPELNMPAAVHIETHAGTGVGGSDDHAGLDIGRTFTETPPSSTPGEFLEHVLIGDAEARGDQGSAAKWTHAAIALAARTLGRGDGTPADPRAVLGIMERVLREGDVRSGTRGEDLRPEHARDLLRAGLEAIAFGGDEVALLDWLESDDFTHHDLHRTARRAHERKLLAALAEVNSIATDGGDLGRAAHSLFDACVAAVPYAPATAVTATSNPTIGASPPSAPSSQVKRAWSWWASTGPAKRNVKSGNCAWTAAIVASICSRPCATASGSTYRASSLQSSSTARRRATGSVWFHTAM